MRTSIPTPYLDTALAFEAASKKLLTCLALGGDEALCAVATVLIDSKVSRRRIIDLLGSIAGTDWSLRIERVLDNGADDPKMPWTRSGEDYELCPAR